MPYRSPSQRAVTPQGKGRFPGFDVLAEVHRWDDVTAGVVLARLAPAADLSYFTPGENGVAHPLCDLLLGQDGEPRVPVVPLIDTRLATAETDGWHYDDLPEDGQAWRDTLAALDHDAHDRFDAGFASLTREQQAALVQAVQTASAGGSDADAPDPGRWHGMDAKHVWSLWTRYATTAFYSHPWAWNEIGFPGPAYPRGYKNLGPDAREPFEVKDVAGTDPVPQAQRVEQARRRHQDMVLGGDGSGR